MVGQVGTGMPNHCPGVPRHLEKIKVLCIAAGGNHTAAVTADHRMLLPRTLQLQQHLHAPSSSLCVPGIFTWGSNAHGECTGYGSGHDILRPHEVTRKSLQGGGLYVACGAYFTACITLKHEGYMWGELNPKRGRSSVGEGHYPITARHACYLQVPLHPSLFPSLLPLLFPLSPPSAVSPQAMAWCPSLV